MRLFNLCTAVVTLSAFTSAFSLNQLFSSDILRTPRNFKQEVLDNIDHGFTTLSHPEYSDYAIRIKKVDPAQLGIDKVKQWSGYLDYKDSKHFFYWFFESRNDPANDPVILWLNGGPGCSSLTGLFFELGPSSIGSDVKPVHNPYSWNNNASIIFLEQPLGVGFSYGDDKITSTELAAKDVYVFLELFFQKFPHLIRNSFHIAGESYAGHYIPQIAHEIVVNHDGIAPFNLSSVLIGNGITDPLIQFSYYPKMACGEGGYHSVLTPEKCQQMEDTLPRCIELAKACYATRQNFICIAASTYCTSKMYGPYKETGLNVYDIRTTCEASDTGLCYKGLDYVSEFLNQPHVQEALGSDVQSYVGCNRDVSAGFSLTGDHSKPFQQFVGELADRDIPVLLYSGDKDYICNWLGNHAWSDELDWKFKDQFQISPLKPFLSKETGEVAGEVKNYGPLTFLRVYDAGHMVPYDQPERSLEMVNRWISGDIALGYR